MSGQFRSDVVEISLDGVNLTASIQPQLIDKTVEKTDVKRDPIFYRGIFFIYRPHELLYQVTTFWVVELAFSRTNRPSSRRRKESKRTMRVENIFNFQLQVKTFRNQNMKTSSPRNSVKKSTPQVVDLRLIWLNAIINSIEKKKHF